MPADVLRPCQAPGLAVPADLDGGQVEGVEHALDAAAGQRRVGLIGPAEQLDRGGLGDEPPLSPQERLAQLLRRRGGERRAGQPPLDRRLAGLPVRPGVVDRLVPGGEQLVQLGQVRDGRAVADLDQELLPHDSEKSFDLPPALGRPGALWVILMPSRAAARVSAASTKADPLSEAHRFARRCAWWRLMFTGWLAGPGRRARRGSAARCRDARRTPPRRSRGRAW